LKIIYFTSHPIKTKSSSLTNNNNTNKQNIFKMVSKGVKKFFGKKSKKTKTTEPVKEDVPEPVAPEAPVDETPVEETPAEEEVREETPVEKKESEEAAEPVLEKDPTAEEAEKAEEDDESPKEEDSVVEKKSSEEMQDVEMKESEKEEESPKEEEEEEGINYKRIDTLHADVTVPTSAKSGDVLDIEHDGTKQIKVPSGQQGQNITVKMISNDEPATGAFCGCF
jgi:hypothetical protein